MVRQRLHRFRRPKEEFRKGIAIPSSVPLKRMSQQETDDDSVLTLPLELLPLAPAKHQETFDGSFAVQRSTMMNKVDRKIGLHHGGSTSTKGKSSANFDLVSETPGGFDHITHMDLEGARQNSLLDAASSAAAESSVYPSLSKDLATCSQSSRQSSGIVRTSSRMSFQPHSMMSFRSKTSKVSIPQMEDDEISWGVNQRASPYPQGQVLVGSQKISKPINDQVESFQTGGTVESDQENTGDETRDDDDDDDDVGDDYDDDEEEEEGGTEWSDAESTPGYSTQLGPSWSAAESSASSKSSSSVALVRKKWRERRQLLGRKTRWNTEDDWCTEDANEDWPGSAPRAGEIPQTIVEEEEMLEGTPAPLKRCSLFACCGQ